MKRVGFFGPKSKYFRGGLRALVTTTLGFSGFGYAMANMWQHLPGTAGRMTTIGVGLVLAFLIQQWIFLVSGVTRYRVALILLVVGVLVLFNLDSRPLLDTGICLLGVFLIMENAADQVWSDFRKRTLKASQSLHKTR